MASSLINLDSERAGRDIIIGELLPLLPFWCDPLALSARLPDLWTRINFFAAPHRVKPDRLLLCFFLPLFWGLPGVLALLVGDLVFVGLAVLLDSEKTR